MSINYISKSSSNIAVAVNSMQISKYTYSTCTVRHMKSLTVELGLTKTHTLGEYTSLAGL